MRVLVCNWRDTSHPRAGGAEVYTHQVLRRWAAAGHDVTLFAAAVSGRPAEEVVDGVRVVRAGSRFGVYRAARRWYRAHGRGRFDVVIDEVNTRPFFCAEWAADARVVGLIHQVAREVWFSEMPLPVAAAGRWWLEPRWLDAYRYVPVLTISESSRESLAGYGLQRVVVVPAGLTDPPSTTGIAKEGMPTIAFVGRLAANKRPDHAIAAFAAVRERFPEARLWVIGDGPMADRLRRDAPAGVHFFGRVDEQTKFELMARAHALVVTSVREGWGLVVDEAAAVGTPTIGYDVDGLRDSVRAAGGRLVEPRPERLATILTASIPDLMAAAPDRRLSYGARSWDEVAAVVMDRIQVMCELDERSAPRNVAPILPVRRTDHEEATDVLHR